MQRTRARFLVLAVVVAAIMVGASAVAFSSWPWGLVAGVGSLAIGVLVVALAIVLAVPGRARWRLTSEGVGVSNSPLITRLLLAMLAAGFLIPIGIIVMWVGSGQKPISGAGPLVLMAGVVLAALPTVAAIVRGRYHLGGLVMGTDEIVYASYRTERSIAWNDVEAVQVSPQNGSVRLTGARDDVQLPSGLLRVEPERLAKVMDFYRTHPRARVELSDSRALARINDDNWR